MTAPTVTGEQKAGIGLLIFAMLVHAIDAVIRLPGGRIDIYVWTIFFVLYAILAITGASRLREWKGPLIASGLAAFVIPFLYVYVAKNWVVIGMLVMLMPTWVIYLLVFKAEQYPRASWLYMVFWAVFLLFSIAPQVQTYAEAQGYELPTVSPGIFVRYTVTTVAQGVRSVYQSIIKLPTAISKEVERSIKIASGDYYTGTVDKSAEKVTGVYVDNLRPAQNEFLEGQPATMFATIRAETIAEPIKIHLTCIAEPGSVAAKIDPESDITVMGSLKQPTDCIFNGLTAKYYNAKLAAEFNYATRAYQKAYFIDTERLNEYRRRGTDPLAGFPDKKPTTQHSPGPLMIGMTESFEAQPVGVTQGKSGPIIGITVDNMWSGQIKKVNDLIIYTPKGLDVNDVNGLPVIPVSCASLRQEESVGCDENLENIYRIQPAEMEKLGKTTVYNYRAHTNVTDSNRLLGNQAVSPKNVKVTIDYEYKYTVEKGFVVKAITN